MNGFLTKILRKEYFYEKRGIYGKKYSRIAWIKISFERNDKPSPSDAVYNQTLYSEKETFHFKISTSIFSATEMTTIKRKKRKQGKTERDEGQKG